MLAGPSTALPPFAYGAEFFAAFEVALALSTDARHRMTREERELVALVDRAAKTYGEYVLEASDREDILVRIDTLLEDPSFQEELRRLFRVELPTVKELVHEATLVEEEYNPRLAAALGPAAITPLRAIQATMQYLAQAIEALMGQIPPEVEVASLVPEHLDPLSFLSDPDVPVPVARGLLGLMRSHGFAVAAASAMMRPQPIDGWRGLALAELWRNELQTGFNQLFIVAGDATGAALSSSSSLAGPALSGRSMREAYAQFNADAERSGEPVYPAAS